MNALWMGACAILCCAAEARAEEDELAPASTSTLPQTAAQPAPYKPFNLYSLLEPDDLRAELELRHLRGGTFPELLERVSRGLVAAPYLLSALGEGRMPDPDPRFRLDAFDCTTFVETAIALAYCDDATEVERVLDRVRYSGTDARFDARNHLMTAQWIPHLVKQGMVEDVTAEVGGAKTKWIGLEMTASRWRKRRIARNLKLPAEVVPLGKFRLPFLTIKDMVGLVKRVPPGTILNILRSDVPSSPEVITHQGLVIIRPGEGVRYVRHASPVSKRVIDESLEKMMNRYLHPRTPRKWPIVGVNILKLVDPREKAEVDGRAER